MNLFLCGAVSNPKTNYEDYPKTNYKGCHDHMQCYIITYNYWEYTWLY